MSEQIGPIDAAVTRPNLDDSSWWLLPADLQPADTFDRVATEIIQKRGAAKVKPPPPPPEPKGPAWHEVAERDDSKAIAFAKGFEAASYAAGMCCGCNTYSHGVVNPYDGTEVTE